jgi:hypothetical protein
MLQGAQQDVAYCQHRAVEANRLAALEMDPRRKQEFLDMEARWLRLAMSYAFADRIVSQRARSGTDHASR